MMQRIVARALVMCVLLLVVTPAISASRTRGRAGHETTTKTHATTQAVKNTREALESTKEKATTLVKKEPKDPGVKSNRRLIVSVPQFKGPRSPAQNERISKSPKLKLKPNPAHDHELAVPPELKNLRHPPTLTSDRRKLRIGAELVLSADWEFAARLLRGVPLVLKSKLLSDVPAEFPTKPNRPLRFEVMPGWWVPLGSRLAERILGESLKDLSELKKLSLEFNFDDLRWLNLQTAGSVSSIAKQIPASQTVAMKIGTGTDAENLERLGQAIAGLSGKFVIVTGHVEGEHFVSKFAGKERFRVRTETLRRQIEKAGGHAFLIGCNLADLASAGPIGTLQPQQVANALKKVRDARTQFEFSTAFASEVSITVDDLKLKDGTHRTSGNTVITAGLVELEITTKSSRDRLSAGLCTTVPVQLPRGSRLDDSPVLCGETSKEKRK
jgi:hypothetical protein